MYTYRMLQLPPSILLHGPREKGNEAAAYMEGVVNKMAREGWDFYRVDSITVAVPVGCLATLLGHKPTISNYYVLTFRQLVQTR
jgi:hypothetical protein